MKLSNEIKIDSKQNTSTHLLIPTQLVGTMLLPGGCTCTTAGSCCSCSCGAVNLEAIK